MIIFTVLGYLFALSTMFWIGYYGAMLVDIRRGIAQWIEPVNSSLEELLAVAHFFTQKGKTP